MQPGTAGVLLERERELKTLRGGLDRACAGEGTLLLIEEPAGVGKTALLREARTAADRAGITALEARSSQLEQPFAFGVVRQLLEPAITRGGRHTDLFTGGAGPAIRLFESDERRPPSADVGFEALHSLYWLVVNIADQAPTLIVDDCQWADWDSLRFLAYLAQRIEGLPVMMLLAAHPPGAATQTTRRSQTSRSRSPIQTTGGNNSAQMTGSHPDPTCSGTAAAMKPITARQCKAKLAR